MLDQINKEPIIAAISDQPSKAQLEITETEIIGLWSIESSRVQTLSSLLQNLFAKPPCLGEMLVNNGLRLLWLSPERGLLLSKDLVLPQLAAEYRSIITDISHGFCQIQVAGNNAGRFLNSYTSVDLNNIDLANRRNLRCLLGQYQIILWWDDLTDIQILVQRSYAQSFYDYLEHLKLRWKGESL